MDFRGWGSRIKSCIVRACMERICGGAGRFLEGRLMMSFVVVEVSVGDA